MAPIVWLALLATGQDLPTVAGRDEALAYYRAHRAEQPDTADGHWRLALWCARHGLKAESDAEAARVTRLDPRRSAAWKHLGYKVHHGRWMNDAQIADEAEQGRADAHWYPRLVRLHDRYQGRDAAHHAEAEAELRQVDEARAVPAVWLAFATGGEGDQGVAAMVLGQVRSAWSTRALAALAALSPSAEVRRRAAETLRSRDPSDYAPPLVGLLHKPLRYRVKTFSNTKQDGELVVTSETATVQFFYDRRHENRPLPFGEVLAYDRDGLARVTMLGAGGRPTLFVDGQGNPDPGAAADLRPDADPLVVPRATGGAERRLEDDIARIEAINAQVRRNNERIGAILADLRGKDEGGSIDAWRAWRDDLLEKAVRPGDPPRTGPIDDRFIALVTRPAHAVVHNKPGCARLLVDPTGPPEDR
jgi:hypothetical protein